MKKINIILITAMILLAIIPFAVAENSQLDVSISKYEPLPAKPGQYVTVYLQVENDGNAPAEDASIEIIDSFPFSIVSESDRTKDLGSISIKQSTVSKFVLKVDSNAVVGVNKLKVKFTSNKNSEYWVEKFLDIEVKPSDSKLSVNSVDISPKKIYPGKDAEVTLTVKNSASIVFREISMQLDLSEGMSDIPFIPMGSLTEKQIAILKPGEITKVTFPIKVYPSATPGYYKIPIDIAFYDEEGSKNEMSDIVGVVVDAMPELKIVADHKSTTADGREISLKCINKGINDLKFLDIEVMNNDKYEIISNPQYYIGDLDSDDYRTADFIIKPLNNDNCNLMIKASYKDENNREYTEEISVPVKIIEKHDNGNGGISFETVFLILLLIVAIVWIVKLKKKSKK